MKATLEFSDRYGLLGLIVRLWTGSWCSHVDIVMDDGRLYGAHPEGVTIHPWTNPRRAERYTVDLPGYDDAFAFAKAQLGQPYNWQGLLGYALHLRWLVGRGWFCSELVNAVCLIGGVDLAPGANSLFVSPKHLLQSPLLVPV